MIKIRNAIKSDKELLLELFDFIYSLGVDLSRKLEKEVFLKILEDCFESTEDRFSYNNCRLIERDGKPCAFYFSYDFNTLELAENYWKKNIVKKYNLKKEDIIFAYDECLEGEYYLDILYVSEKYRGEGLGSKLLKDFLETDAPIKSLNVSKGNTGARKLYESFGMKKEGEIMIAGEYYEHMVFNN